MMGHDTLHNYFKTNFSLKQFHGWDIPHIENMLPWERYVYLGLLQDYLKDEEKKAQLRAQEQKSQMAQMQRQMAARKR